MAEADARRRTWLTYGLIAANLFAFVLEIAAGVSAIKPTAASMIDAGGNFPPLTLHGEPWRLLSSMFLHYGLIHIALNMVGLWQGRVVELIYGRAGFGAIYLGSGLLGGVACMAASSEAVAAGASGAVFGVYGAFGAFLTLRRAAMPAEVWQSTVRQMVMFLGINLVYGIATPGISMSAHLGGLAAGFAIGAGLLTGPTADRRRVPRAAALALAAIALTAGALFVLRAPRDITPTLAEFDRVHAACLARFDEVAARNAAGTSPDAQAADEIERDVLAPWTAIRAKLAAIDGAPERLGPMLEALAVYVAARQAAWEASVAALRAPPDARASRMADFTAKDQAATQAFETVTSRLTALKP